VTWQGTVILSAILFSYFTPLLHNHKHHKQAFTRTTESIKISDHDQAQFRGLFMLEFSVIRFLMPAAQRESPLSHIARFHRRPH
ncbi:MAG: hypothetical protein ABW126_16520, partial [Candidatus Sedimenticola sp. 4PFRAG1]